MIKIGFEFQIGIVLLLIVVAIWYLWQQDKKSG
jgi:hypothetical protein